MAKDQLEGENVRRSITSTWQDHICLTRTRLTRDTGDLCFAGGAQTQAERGKQIHHRIWGIFSRLCSWIGASVWRCFLLPFSTAAAREEGQNPAAEAGRSTTAGAGGRPWKGRWKSAFTTYEIRQKSGRWRHLQEKPVSCCMMGAGPKQHRLHLAQNKAHFLF